MTARRRIAVWLLVTAGGLLTAAVLLTSLFLNSDRYRRRVISYFEANTGKEVEMERLTVTFFPKVTLHFNGFGVKSPPPFPPSYIVKVQRADAVLDSWALLRGRVAIKSLVLDGLEINLMADPDGPWNFHNPGTTNAENTFPLGVIGKVVIKRGQLLVSNLLPSDAAGPVFLEAHDIASELDSVDLAAIVNPASPALSGHGDWNASRLRFGAVEATHVNCDFRLQSREVYFTGFTADAYGGKVTGDFSVSLLRKSKNFKADARMSRINVTRLLAAFHEPPGTMTGKLEGNLTLAGPIEHTSRPLVGMSGTGHLKVTNGQVPSLMLNANLLRLVHFNDLGPAKEHPSSFASFSADVELANLRISSKTIDIDGYGVDVDGLGSVSVSGSRALSYQGVATITAEQGFFTKVVARLAGAHVKNGKLSFPFRIEGTIDAPKFSKGT